MVTEKADGSGGRFKVGRCRHLLENMVRWKEKGAVGVYEGGSVG